MANEQQIEALEQARKLTQEKISEIEQSLASLKQEALSKLKEIDTAIETARQQSQPISQVSEPIKETIIVTETKVAEPTPFKEIVKEQPIAVEEKPKAQPQKPTEHEGKKTKKEEEKDKFNKIMKSRANEKQQLAELKESISKRTKGDKPAEPGNVGIKHTTAEVFIYVIDDNALQLKVLLEKFKTTKSFKAAKGFTSGDDCLNYIKKHRYPKNSMIMVVVDYYLDDKGNGEESNTGIDVLHKLKDYDSDIEVIVLSGSDDVDIAASATHFGAVSFVKKGEDDFKKIVNNMVWAIHEKAKIRKKAETKAMIRIMAISLSVFSIMSFVVYFVWLYFQMQQS